MAYRSVLFIEFFKLPTQGNTMQELMYIAISAQLIALILITIFGNAQQKDVNKWLSEI